MKYTKILIKQDGAYALSIPDLSMPERNLQFAYPHQYLADVVRYSKAYQQALDNAVKFRDGIYFNFPPDWKIGKTYPCPSGFEIVIGIWCEKDCMGMCGECDHAEKYATLKNIK